MLVNILGNIGLDLWNTLCEMSPYLLFGFFVAGILSILITPATVEKHLGGKGIWPVIKASLLGVPLPLCSCGVIPVAASLRRHGSSKGATAAFLISTPQTGVDSIAVTYGMLGPVMAVFRPLAAFVSGLIGGWLIDKLETKQSALETNGNCTDECCTPGPKRNTFLRIFNYSFVTLPRDIAKPLMVGLFIAGIISAVIPEGFFAEKLHSELAQMLIMIAIGIPLYVCATASVPIAAAMVMKGISPGAALVFLMAGPATNAATIAVIWKTLGKRSAVIYLAVVAGTALISGLLLNSFFATEILSHEHTSHTMLPQWLHSASAVAVLIMLAATFFGTQGKKIHKHETTHDHPESECACQHET